MFSLLFSTLTAPLEEVLIVTRPCVIVSPCAEVKEKLSFRPVSLSLPFAARSMKRIICFPLPKNEGVSVSIDVVPICWTSGSIWVGICVSKKQSNTSNGA